MPTRATARANLKRLEAIVEVVAAGAGPYPPGPGQEVLTFAFDYTTPTQQLGAYPTGMIVLRADLLVTVPFDDPAATASFGTAANPAEFLDTIGVHRTGQYGEDALTLESVPEVFLFTMAPGASTQGEGLLVWVVKTP